MPASPRNRIEEQRLMTTEAILAELPRHCSFGVKKSSKGHLRYWRGYKLHLDVADGQIPISALLTGASVHDSQVAMPLMNLTSQRVTNLYDLMDAAYDANAIRAHRESLGHRHLDRSTAAPTVDYRAGTHPEKLLCHTRGAPPGNDGPITHLGRSRPLRRTNYRPKRH